MARGKGERGDSIDIQSWWMDLVNEMVDKRPEKLVEIGARVAELVGRKAAWDHGAVRRFLDNEVTTREMAIGFSRFLGIPQPYYDARTPAEAFDLQRVHDRYSQPSESNPDKVRKLSVLDQAADVAEEEIDRHMERVESPDDERTSGRRRARRPSKGRPATS